MEHVANEVQRRTRFYKDAANLCSQFSSTTDGLSIHFKLFEATGNFDKSSNLSRNENDFDAIRMQKNKGCDMCLKCGCNFSLSGSKRHNNINGMAKLRLRPKTKTSKTVLRLLKKKRKGSKALHGKFPQRMFSQYFDRPNRLLRTCLLCKTSTLAVVGEKRSNDTFVERHLVRRKNSKELKKLQKSGRLVNTDASRPIGATSSANAKSQSTPLTKRSDVRATNSSTQSPMQTLTTTQPITKKTPTVQHRVTSKSSAAIIRQYQQKNVARVLKSKEKQTKSGTKSDLDKFLQAMK